MNASLYYYKGYSSGNARPPSPLGSRRWRSAPLYRGNPEAISSACPRSAPTDGRCTPAAPRAQQACSQRGRLQRSLALAMPRRSWRHPNLPSDDAPAEALGRACCATGRPIERETPGLESPLELAAALRPSTMNQRAIQRSVSTWNRRLHCSTCAIGSAFPRDMFPACGPGLRPSPDAKTGCSDPRVS